MGDDRTRVLDMIHGTTGDGKRCGFMVVPRLDGKLELILLIPAAGLRSSSTRAMGGYVGGRASRGSNPAPVCDSATA
jgi:hypothetical protein